MNEILKLKMPGLNESISTMNKDINQIIKQSSTTEELMKYLKEQLQNSSFDEVIEDDVNNLIGCVSGYNQQESIAVIANIDLSSNKFDYTSDRQPINKNGIEGTNINALITAYHTGLLLKRSIAPLNGNVYICFLPRFKNCNFGIQYLFDNYLKDKKIKAVILCEPTDLKVNIGNKGQMEYEIVINGKINNPIIKKSNLEIMGSMYPIINELTEISGKLPSDRDLGESSLEIKDFMFSNINNNIDNNMMSIKVDRTYVPEEQPTSILKKAKTLTQKVYNSSQTNVMTQLVNTSIETNKGKKLLTSKNYKPWKMDPYNEVIRSSCQALTENKISAEISHWKKIVTEGSYTFGEKGIPTLGYGIGKEGEKVKNHSVKMLGQSILGKSTIIYRLIGMPTFGWSADDI